MQWLDTIFKFLAKIFKSNAFKTKYKTKSSKHFLKYLHSPKWQVADLRNDIDYQENHIEGTINLSWLFFKQNYFKKINKKKNILLLNNNFRTNLNIYNTLQKKGFKVYILYDNYKELITKPGIDQYVFVVVY